MAQKKKSYYVVDMDFELTASPPNDRELITTGTETTVRIEEKENKARQ